MTARTEAAFAALEQLYVEEGAALANLIAEAPAASTRRGAAIERYAAARTAAIRFIDTKTVEAEEARDQIIARLTETMEVLEGLLGAETLHEFLAVRERFVALQAAWPTAPSEAVPS